ncbi:MAG: hypothetical protein V3U35_08805 [Candidatus Neomarinimicrobiota bacterium]
MAKPLAASPPEGADKLRVRIGLSLERLDPVLDALFLWRPILLIPAWIAAAAGLSAGQWVNQPDLIWHTEWSWRSLLMFTGLSLTVGASFARGQLAQGASPEKGHPRIRDWAWGLDAFERRLTWTGLGLGLVLLLPAGWLALAWAGVTFLLWGVLFSRAPAFWRDRPALETAVHSLAATTLFLVGWAASGAPWSRSMVLAAPYMLAFAGIGVHFALLAGPGELATASRPSTRQVATASAVAMVLTLAAALWGSRNGDPVIATAATLTLPFYLVALVYKRERDLVRSGHYAILIGGIFVGARYPWLYPPIIAVFYLSRFYYKRRLGTVHPSLS